MEIRDIKFQPYFCEENIWHLCQRDEFSNDDVWVVFISNSSNTVATWCQRDGQGNAPVVWDYHVVMARDNQGLLEVWDLNSTLVCPCEWDPYFTFTFRLRETNEFTPTFRFVPRDPFVSTFRSDRSHMEPGECPFPEWDPISTESNLSSFIEMGSDQIGEVVDLETLRGGWTPYSSSDA